MKSEDFVKVWVQIEGRPLGRWKNRVKEYMSLRGEGCIKKGRECVDRERWKVFCCGQLLGGHSQEGARCLSYR